MEITEQKALTMARLEDLVKTKNEDYFTEVTQGDKTLHVAYTNTEGFLSVIFYGKDKIYVFIEDSLTEKKREPELKLIVDDKDLHHFNSDEIKEMDELAEQQKLKEKVIKNITYGDVENIVKNHDLTFEDVNGAYALINIIEKFNKYKSGAEWNNACAMAFAFKLGEMHGKREERLRRKKSKF